MNEGARPQRPRPHYLEHGSCPCVLRPAGKDAPMPGRQPRMAQHHISARKGSGLRAAARQQPTRALEVSGSRNFNHNGQ